MILSVWDLFISLNMYNHQGVLYLVIRTCLYWQGDILNLHLVSIPVFDKHTGENMFNVSATFFECIYQEWQKMLVVIAPDGARITTGCIQGRTTLFEQGMLLGLIQVWCGGHQLDLLL